MPDSAAVLHALGRLQSGFDLDAQPAPCFEAWLAPLLEITGSQFALLAEWVALDHDTGFLRVLAASNLAWDDRSHLAWQRHLQGQPLEFHNLDNLLGAAMQGERALLANHPASDARRGSSIPGHPALENFLGLPLCLGAHKVGLLGLANRDGGFSQELADCLQPLVRCCAQQLGLYQQQRQRAQLELGLRQGRSRHEAIWDSTGEALLVLDVHGQIESANTAASRLTGFSAAELAGRSFASLMPSGRWLELQSILQALPLQHRQPALLFDRCGTMIDSELVFSLLQLPHGPHYVCVLRDLRTQRQQERELARLSHELDTILTVCPDGVVAFDQQRRVNYCNPAFCAMVGWRREDLAGLTLAEFDARFARLGHEQQPLPEVLARDEAEVHLHLQHPRPCVLSRSVRHTGGSYGAGLVLYFRDVTRETEIDRMKTEFLSTAAHELRTPLASIFGFAELLLQRRFDADTQHDLVQTIYRQSQALIRLINELLDIARIEARAGKFFSIAGYALPPLIDDCVRQFSVNYPERQIRVETPGQPMPGALVDAGKFSQMLQNVLSNALKFSAPGQEVCVRQLLDAGSHPGQVGVQVEDGGIGMTPEQLERIFERFYRADPHGPVPGSGLGMSLVREIIDVLKGDINIQSWPGRGTRVTLWLPMADRSVAEHAA